MPRIPKKQSYNYRFFFSLFLPLYIILPVYLTACLKSLSFKLLLVFYLINTLIIFYLLNRHSKIKYRLKLAIQDLRERENILNEQNLREINNGRALQERIKRYNSLKRIIEKINQNLGLDYIADNLADAAFSFIAREKGLCILYLVDNKTQKLTLFRTKRQDQELIIKTKEGDIFDFWVLRHISPLLIEDIRKDFRFDLEKLKREDARPFLSLISSPFISENRFLGIIRLDNSLPGSYSQDDLRLLATISDIGAIALENSQLFQRTQELAIHDGLTSLYTKGYFLERLKEECNRSIRQGQTLPLLMLDIDYFKNYNDKFGHTAGDIVLKNLSFNIVDFLKDANPIVGRFGGEEFCIALPGKDKLSACRLAEELRLKVEGTKIILRRQETNITVSIGVAALPEDAACEDELVHSADRAMYAAKQKGRNRVISA